MEIKEQIESTMKLYPVHSFVCFMAAV